MKTKRENDNEPPFCPSRRMREVYSWKLVAEFARRHPNFGTLIEAHPGGGQYDCLAFCREGSMSLAINRVGSITFLDGGPDDRIDSREVWEKGLEEEGIRKVLDQMSELVGLRIPSPLPSTTKEALTYRVVSVFMSALVFDKRSWQCLNGMDDTAGYSNQEIRDAWFDRFPEAKENLRITEKNDFSKIPLYRFWFILCDDAPVACLSKNAVAYLRSGETVDLMSKYRQGDSVEKLAAVILATI